MTLNNTDSNHRTKLNSTQLDILRVLVKFRFGSNDLIARYYGKKDRSYIARRMALLVDKGLIAKRFDSSYRIKSKPAAYCLTPNGVRELGKHQDKNVNVKAAYRNAEASEDFVDHSLKIFSIHNELKLKHDHALKLFTRADLGDFDYFPKPLPAAYIRLDSHQYFLELLKASDPPFVAKRLIQRYLNYARESNWEDTGTDLPAIVLVCDTDTLQKRVDKLLTRHADDIDLEDLKFIVTMEPVKVV